MNEEDKIEVFVIDNKRVTSTRRILTEEEKKILEKGAKEIKTHERVEIAIDKKDVKDEYAWKIEGKGKGH